MIRRHAPHAARPAAAEAPAAEYAGSAPATAARATTPSAPAPTAEPDGVGLRWVPRPGTQPRPVPVTVWRRVDVSVEEAFDGTVPIDLASVFRGYGPLPAVVGTAGELGPWGRSGQSREVRLADGGLLREAICEVQRPGLFRYEVVPVEGALRLFVHHIDGQFVFARSEAGGTAIRWTYVFRPRRGASPVVRGLAPLWRRYARQVLARIAAQLEHGRAPT